MDGTRREFLTTSSAGLGGAWLAMQLPAIDAAATYARQAAADRLPLAALTEEEAREIEAVAARIIPTDDTPGAREAGVIRFIDRALETFQAEALPLVRQGVVDLEARAGSVDGSVTYFSELAPAQQDEILREIESEPFFGVTRMLTVMGMFALPDYGGNRDKIGWQLLGFEDRYRWAPPFGHYDEEATRG